MTRQTLTAADGGYPKNVLCLADPPALRVRGHIAEGPAIAIVGARRGTEAARQWAYELAKAAVQEGIVVWSGGARGIDAAAHRGAMDGNGKTVVVLGGGLDHPSPPENVELFDEVANGKGAVVSRFDDDVRPIRPGFLSRNEVLAAAADLVVIVECELQSGAKNASAHARRLGRRVAVVPQPPWTKRGKGCMHELEAFGATALRDEDHAIRMVLEASGRTPTSFAPRPQQLGLPSFSAEELAILRAVQLGAGDCDAVSTIVGRPSPDVSVEVLELELRGAILRTHRGLELAASVARLQSLGDP